MSDVQLTSCAFLLSIYAIFYPWVAPQFYFNSCDSFWMTSLYCIQPGYFYIYAVRQHLLIAANSTGTVSLLNYTHLEQPLLIAACSTVWMVFSMTIAKLHVNILVMMDRLLAFVTYAGAVPDPDLSFCVCVCVCVLNKDNPAPSRSSHWHSGDSRW